MLNCPLLRGFFPVMCQRINPLNTQNNNFIVDSHCHLNYKGLDDDVKGVIARANARNVQTLLAINTKIHEFDAVYKIAEENENVFATVGVHPHEADSIDDLSVDTLLSRAKKPKCVGLGETGLDYYYDNAPRDKQRENFRLHIHAARESGLPLVVHTRDAEDDTINIMTEEMKIGPYKGVIHCFTASQNLADKCLDMGFYISLSGILTFKNARDLQATAKTIPLDRVLVETDAPFLAPVPHRGQICEPAYTADTLAFLANLREMDEAELMAHTTNNFFTLFDKAQRPVL